MHAHGIQFGWLCLFALSPPEGKKRKQVQEVREGSGGGNGAADRRPVGQGWGCVCGRTVQQARMQRWTCHVCTSIVSGTQMKSILFSIF